MDRRSQRKERTVTQATVHRIMTGAPIGSTNTLVRSPTEAVHKLAVYTGAGKAKRGGRSGAMMLHGTSMSSIDGDGDPDGVTPVNASSSSPAPGAVTGPTIAELDRLARFEERLRRCRACSGCGYMS